MATSAEIAARVTAWAPRFADSAWTSRVTSFSAAALRTHDEPAFLGVFVDAMTCWVLHWLILAEREDAFGGGVSGPVTSIRTGDESIGFQQSAMSDGGAASDAQYKETSWGKRYLSYRDSRPAAHLFVI